MLLGGAAAVSETAKVTPIQKVLSLMEELKAKGTKEKNAEEVRFSAFAQWCGDTKRTKAEEIEAGEAKMEELEARLRRPLCSSGN